MTTATAPTKPAPVVSHIINYGTAVDPHGEVYFQGSPNLVVAFGSGRVWLRKGGFGIKEAHYRAAYAYLVALEAKGFRRFSRDRVGKPSR